MDITNAAPFKTKVSTLAYSYDDKAVRHFSPFGGADTYDTLTTMKNEPPPYETVVYS